MTNESFSSRVLQDVTTGILVPVQTFSRSQTNTRVSVDPSLLAKRELLAGLRPIIGKYSVNGALSVFTGPSINGKDHEQTVYAESRAFENAYLDDPRSVEAVLPELRGEPSGKLAEPAITVSQLPQPTVVENISRAA